MSEVNVILLRNISIQKFESWQKQFVIILDPFGSIFDAQEAFFKSKGQLERNIFELSTAHEVCCKVG